MKEKAHLSCTPLFTLLLISVFGSGCATIIHGTTQNIPVSSVPTGAKVTVDQSTAYTTPTVLDLPRKENHTIQVSLEGYNTEVITLQSVISGAVMGNLLLGGLIGWGVDAASGAQNRLVPESVHITLQPIKAPNVQERSTPTQGLETLEKRLEDLNRLRKKELITEEEYQESRKKLINKLSQNVETVLAVKPPVNKIDWSLVKAPVYKDGDSWVFRVKEKGYSAEEYQITYNNGKFESDDPAFLRGEDIPNQPSFLPFATVYLNDPEKKWLDFPLVPGKKWSFRYPRNSYISGRPAWGFADAEVVGPVALQVKTPAGSFNVIKIRRTDTLSYSAELTYFYSPETKSVVKLTAKILGGSGRHFEMELVKISLH